MSVFDRRRLDPISVPAESGRRRVHRFYCSACNVVHDVPANTFGGSRNKEDLARVLSRAGWQCSENPARDLCPQCSSRARKKQRANLSVVQEAPAEDATVMKHEAPPTKPAVMVSEPSAPLADPPPALGVDETLVIFQKLAEVYVDKDTGYADGWSDKRVGEDLNVPRDWVRTIREKAYGPAGDNPEIREALAEAKRLHEETTETLLEITRERRALQELLRQTSERIAAFEKVWTPKVSNLEHALSRIDKTVAAIEKAVR